MVTPTLIRAARGILDWTQEDLRQRVGLSKAGLTNIERGASKPYPSSLSRIQAAFDEAGVVFILGSRPGVKLRQSSIKEAKARRQASLIPAQIRAARMLIASTQLELCRRAGLSVPALVRIEHGMSSPKPSTLAAIRKALEEAGVEFIDGGEPGVMLSKQS